MFVQSAEVLELGIPGEQQTRELVEALGAKALAPSV